MKIFLLFTVIICLAIFLVPNIVYLIVKGICLVFHFRCTWRPFMLTALGLVVLWLVLSVYGYCWGRFRHEQKHIELTITGLPDGFRGYNIVHISNLHLDGYIGHEQEMRAIVDEINSLDADVIFFTGDLVSLSERELDTFVPILRSLKARDGVYSILGNHDYMPYTRGWNNKQREEHLQKLVRMEKEDLGWHLLMNEYAVLHRGSDSLAVIGCENQSLGIHNVVVRGDLKKAMAGTDGMCRILLTHDPTHWRGEVLGKTDIPLTLSGHTHGGQVNFFGLFYFSTFIYKEHAGLYTANGQNLYVNIGLGATMPMRIGATPEITRITLH